MEAAAPVAPAIPAESPARTAGVDTVAGEIGTVETQVPEAGHVAPGYEVGDAGVAKEYEVVDGVKTPLPIAVSGELKIMPPSTGLPAARNGGLNGLLEAIPAAETAETPNESAETAAHGN